MEEATTTSTAKTITLYPRVLPKPKMLPPWKWLSYLLTGYGRITEIVLALREHGYYDPYDNPEIYPGFIWIRHDIIRIRLPKLLRLRITKPFLEIGKDER